MEVLQHATVMWKYNIAGQLVRIGRIIQYLCGQLHSVSDTIGSLTLNVTFTSIRLYYLAPFGKM